MHSPAASYAAISVMATFIASRHPAEPDLLPPATENDILGPEGSLAELTRCLADGARFVRMTVNSADGAELTTEPILPFLIGVNRDLRAATGNIGRAVRSGDTVIRLTAPT
jgi:hypothetical protein